MSGMKAAHAYGLYTDPDFPGVVWRRPGAEPAGKRWKPVRIFGTKTYRDQTDEEWRQMGTNNRQRKELFEEDPQGDDFIIRQQLVDIEPMPATEAETEPAATAPQAAPAAAAPQPTATPAPASVQPSTVVTPTDTPQFGQTSALVTQQTALHRRTSPVSRTPRRPLLTAATDQDTLGAFPT